MTEKLPTGTPVEHAEQKAWLYPLGRIVSRIPGGYEVAWSNWKGERQGGITYETDLTIKPDETYLAQQWEEKLEHLYKHVERHSGDEFRNIAFNDGINAVIEYLTSEGKTP